MPPHPIASPQMSHLDFTTAGVNDMQSRASSVVAVDVARRRSLQTLLTVAGFIAFAAARLLALANHPTSPSSSALLSALSCSALLLSVNTVVRALANSARVVNAAAKGAHTHAAIPPTGDVRPNSKSDNPLASEKSESGIHTTSTSSRTPTAPKFSWEDLAQHRRPSSLFASIACITLQVWVYVCLNETRTVSVAVSMLGAGAFGAPWLGQRWWGD